MRYVLVASAFLFSCGSDTPNPLIPGFNPPPPPSGYTRFVIPPIHGLQPGANEMYCQWIAPAAATDMDVLDVQGYQTRTGHHAVLYATSETTEPVGTSRPCTTQDMLSVEFLGGVGGEGTTDSAKLPPGVVFRLHAGKALMANTHYLNATSETLDVQSVIDAQIAAPSPDHKAVGMNVINFASFTIPPGAPYHVDAYCNWTHDASLIMWSNHMHAEGVSAITEVKHADGTIENLATDTSWQAEEAFNPKWARWDINSPLKIKAGDQVHIRCEWQNTGTNATRFPDEMCDGVGFYLESSEVTICDAQ